MDGCNILTISKVTIEKNDDLEFSKIYNSLINNSKIGLFIDSKNDDDNRFYYFIINLLQDISTDIVEKCLSIIDDISMEIEYDQPINELSLKIKLLLTKKDQMFDPSFFETCISLSDKYEEFIIENNMTETLSIEFDVMLKNEFTKVITIKEERRT